MGIRIVSASIVLITIVLIAVAFAADSRFGAEDMFGLLFAVPIVILFMSTVALLCALASQIGIPFAGIMSWAFNIPLILGDVLIWCVYRIRPNWIPVDDPRFINPIIVWVNK
jgi:hypothetical protein